MKQKQGRFTYFGKEIKYDYIEYESLDELPNKVEILNKINLKTKLEAMKEKEKELIKW